MKLADLDPRWSSEEGRRGQSMTFLCPLCRSMRLGVPFANPVDGGPPLSPEKRGSKDGYLWQRTGDSFESMTLSPSVDASKVERSAGMADDEWARVNRPCREGGWSCWHGHVTDGQITA